MPYSVTSFNPHHTHLTLYLTYFILFLALSPCVHSFNNWFRQPPSLFGPNKANIQMVQHFDDTSLPSWEELDRLVKQTTRGKFMQEQESLREEGEGLPHTDAKIRRFGTTGEPRVTLYRDSAAWCPYCQKVWIMLEEKRIPYKIEKINMRSYGDKPQSFLRLVPNGLLPAITLDGEVYTESIDIMILLDQEFSGSKFPQLWPKKEDEDHERAVRLMRLERDLFSRWCSLVFRPSYNSDNKRYFEQGLDLVNRELSVTSGPWFLDRLSIVDLQYVTHIERMCASVAYWCGLKIRDDDRWPAIERWFNAFESLPSYMATKSDYYTHVMDIPPQYGKPYPLSGSEALARQIDGSDNSWNLPLPPFSPSDVQPVSPAIDPGEESARHEAAYKLIANNKGVVKFALRGAGSPGKKSFQVR